jgi:hypothetical protein
MLVLMQTCPNCQAENKDQDVYCYRCGHLLPSVQLNAQDESGTKILKGATQQLALPKRSWGTARLDSEELITFRVKGAEEPLQIYLGEEEIVIGRTHGDVTVDVDLTPYEAAEKGVSRRHTKIKRENDTVTIIDLGSANNTYINGQKIVPNEVRILRDGDELRLGRLVMRVHFGEDL